MIRRTKRYTQTWLAMTAVALLALQMVAMLLTPSAEARVKPGVYPIITPDLTYLGNATCSGSECHSAEQAKKQSGQMIGDELNIWLDYDPHAFTYDQLSNDQSKKIAAKLDIADAAKSDRCLSCHAMNAPKDHRGDKFSITDAVGCESCHGPAEKWKDPHAKEGWTMAERNKLGAQGLIDSHGLIDTTHLSVRAHTCVSCHLQIDKDMIDAGHPPLEFELYSYNYYVSKKPNKEYYIHWGDGERMPLHDARLWAAGQIAAHEAATIQVDHWKEKGWDTAQAESLAELYANGAKLVEKHFGATTAEQVHNAEMTADQAAAAAKDLAALGGEADDNSQRRTIGMGVTALGSAVFEARGKQVPDAFWEHYPAAIAGQEGQPYLDALKKMADLAQ